MKLGYENAPFNFEVYQNGSQSEAPCSFGVPLRLVEYEPLMAHYAPFKL